MSLTELPAENMDPAESRTPALGERETRSIAVEDFELRAAADTLTLRGYASVFDKPYDMGAFTEVVDKRAFDQTLKQQPDVQLLVNHDGTPLARTKSGTLDLTTDAKGLNVVARLDPASPAVQVIRSAMQRGDMDEMSFAFRTVRQDFNEDTSVRRLLEVNIHKGDVSVVNYGASPHTAAQMRAAAELERVLLEVRSSTDPVAALEHAQKSLGVVLRDVGAPRLSVADAVRIIDGRD